MTRPIATLALLLLLALPVWAGQPIPARCVDAVDGDSLRVELDGVLVDVRLLGIDAPEYDQAPWGEVATAFAKDWCARAGVVGLELDVQERDRYRRTLAYVWSGQSMLNLELIQRGLAVPYTWPPNVAHATEIAAAQDQARAARAGFWKDGGLAQSPHDFRKVKSVGE
ncbi:MAG: thermonuclease family protein [Thermodesulfobacteriota bacterium]